MIRLFLTFLMWVMEAMDTPMRRAGRAVDFGDTAAIRRWFAVGGVALTVLPLSAAADTPDRTEARARMVALVTAFERDAADFTSRAFKERDTRDRFIDTFFEILGWDMRNLRRAYLFGQEVIPETRLRIGRTMRYADYGFRLDGRAVFYVEAKAANQNIDDPKYVFQAKRYAWSSMRAELAVLTDFETFRVYDARLKPDIDAPGAGELTGFRLSYREYVDHFDILWNTFSREAVTGGSIDSLLEKSDPELERVTVDRAFLSDLDGFRLALGRDIRDRNGDLALDQLNEAAHHILNMLVFARILEDRDIEPTGRLREVLNLWHATGGRSLFSLLLGEFKRFRKRYRGVVFGAHFSHRLIVGDTVLQRIITALYPPASPYEFSIIPVAVLGKAYEKYLGKRLAVEADAVVLESKPEVRKAGGVFYTPEWITDYIVDRTLGPKLEGMTPGMAGDLNLIDLACGSGAFTTKLADRLFAFAEDYYTAHPKAVQGTDTEFPDAYLLSDGRMKLSVRKKAELVEASVFCVDVDRQAAEVTKMWLYILMLEDEGSPIVTAERKYRVPNRAWPKVIESFELPDLTKNVVWANVLVGPDFEADPRERYKARAFAWTEDAVKIARIVNEGGFDVIVSNPPYIRLSDMKKFIPAQYRYMRRHYASMGWGQPDLSYAFIEKGQALLKEDGRLGFITSNGFIYNAAGQNLRRLIVEAGTLSELIDFGMAPIFEDARPTTAIVVLHKRDNPTFKYAKVHELGRPRELVGLLSQEEHESETLHVQTADAAFLRQPRWAFPAPSGQAEFEALQRQPLRLEDVAKTVYGIKTGANDVFIVKAVHQEGGRTLVRSKATKRQHWIETAILRPIVMGRDVRRYKPLRNRLWLIWPYEADGRLMSEADIGTASPLAYGYLLANREALLRRAISDGSTWYELASARPEAVMRQAKLLVGWAKGASQFTVDGSGGMFFANIIGAAVVPKDNAPSLDALLGTLNSATIRRFVETISPELRGGHVYSASTLDTIPIVPVTDKSMPLYDTIAEKVRDILGLPTDALAKRERLEAEIDALVERLYGIGSAVSGAEAAD